MGEFCLRAIKLKISSVSTPFLDVASKTNAELESPLHAFWLKVRLVFWKLDRLLTAISYAEAGNLDAVQEILDQNKAMANAQHDKINKVRSADGYFMPNTKHI